MKKLIIGGLATLVIGAIGLGINNPFLNNNDIINGQKDMMNLQLYGNYTVDASGVRKYFSLLDDVPLIGFFQVSNSEHLQELANAIDLEFPNNFDFNFDDYQDKFLLITFGRQLVEIQYEYRKGDYYENVPFTEIIFTAEHQAQTMYVYIMDRIRLWDADLSSYGYNSFYVMSGSEKVFIGNNLQSFNKQSPNFKEGI